MKSIFNNNNNRNKLYWENYDDHIRPKFSENDIKSPKKNSKKIKEYTESGKAIYEDGTTEEAIINEVDKSDLGLYEEKWDKFVDHKPNGPQVFYYIIQSVGIDIAYNNIQRFYGLPEHAITYVLKNTAPGSNFAYAEPYRLYNLDVFEYELNSTMALY